jgi:uncharacterized glyoxalase superfamily protein PhnB
LRRQEVGMADQDVFPSFRYRDAPGAIAWLVDVLGFEVRALHEADDGSVAHAELSHGAGMIMLGSERDDVYGGRTGGGFTYIVASEVDDLYERARSKGAEITHEIEDADYGSRGFSVQDPEGNVWSFGTYRPSAS